MVSKELKRRAQYYLDRRQAQELDHTDTALNDARTEAHDALMMQMDIEGIQYTSREHAAQLARDIVAGHTDEDAEAQIDATQLRIWISILEKHSDVPAQLLSWLQQMASVFEQLEAQEEREPFLSTSVLDAVQESLF